MENGVAEVCKQSSSYRYWVRESTESAAPLPVHRKLSSEDLPKQSPPVKLGSAWNHAGTWEEKNLNTWATGRIKELLNSLDSLEFSGGKASVSEVSKCTGDAFLVTVRNKKRVGYTYEITLDFKGEWLIKEEKKTIKGSINIHEFSFGELDDLQVINVASLVIIFILTIAFLLVLLKKGDGAETSFIHWSLLQDNPILGH